jgi:hypothetical protein
MERLKHIKRIHRGDLISDNLYASAQGYIGFDELIHDDIDFINVGFGRADSEPIAISELTAMIDELSQRGSTHVSIEYNCDHDEYEVSGFMYENLSTAELEAIQDKKMSEYEKLEKIRILEKQIQAIKNS